MNQACTLKVDASPRRYLNESQWSPNHVNSILDRPHGTISAYMSMFSSSKAKARLRYADVHVPKSLHSISNLEIYR